VGSGLIGLVVVKTSSPSWLTLSCGGAMGAIAKTQTVDGKAQRGFAFYVGGGLGSVPYKAKLFDAFLPEEELLPTLQAISRVFARLGEKRNRARARIKFLIANLGIDEFRKLVLEERQKLPADPLIHEGPSTGP